jgi:heme/copper-type cytochrome/quinol oxidase subunit 1
MRLRRPVPMLVAAVSAAAIAAPAAQARFDNTTYPPLGAPYAVHHGGSSTDWTLVALGAAGGVALIGAGTATSLRATRRTAHVRAASGS